MKRVTVNHQNAPISKHDFDGYKSKMSPEYLAYPVLKEQVANFYSVIIVLATAHFFLLSPLNTPHKGQEGRTDTDYWKTTYRAVLSSTGVPACRKHC